MKCIDCNTEDGGTWKLHPEKPAWVCGDCYAAMYVDYHQNKHLELVRRLAKPGEEILKTLTPVKCHQIHMILGMLTELGELADAFKKHIVYDRPLHIDNVIEESGDYKFYSTGLEDSVSITYEQIVDYNFDKLNKRYTLQTYSNEQAVARADKQ